MPRNYRLWTPDEESAALLLVELHGVSGYRRFAKQSGRTSEAVRMHLANHCRPAWTAALARHRLADAVGDPAQATPAAWLERFRPIQMPAPQRRAASVTPVAGITLVAGDLHFPTQDDRAVAVFLETCRRLKPARVILNGDLPDLLAVSKYPKDVRHGHAWTLGDEARAMHAFLHELERVLPAGTEILETEANHSGNGTASRWWRYISDAAGALVTLPDAEAKLSYQAWWYPTWSRLRLVEQVLLADDLLVLHGDIVRKHAAYSARATMEKWASSVMHNHTHRQGSGAQHVPPHIGRTGHQMRFYETGCLCTLTPSYASAANWTQGFAIVQEGEGPREFGVELVTIQQGRAVVTTLGETVRAA